MYWQKFLSTKRLKIFHCLNQRSLIFVMHSKFLLEKKSLKHWGPYIANCYGKGIPYIYALPEGSQLCFVLLIVDHGKEQQMILFRYLISYVLYVGGHVKLVKKVMRNLVGMGLANRIW